MVLLVGRLQYGNDRGAWEYAPCRTATAWRGSVTPPYRQNDLQWQEASSCRTGLQRTAGGDPRVADNRPTKRRIVG